MPLFVGTRRALLGAPSVLAYLLRDEFTDTLTAGNVNGTAATPGPGTRTVVDTDNKLSISSGALQLDIKTANGDPRIHYGSIARAAGRLLVAEMTNAAENGKSNIGFDSNETSNLNDPAVYFVDASATINMLSASSSNVTAVGAFSAATSYAVAFALRAAGHFCFIKGGAYASWTLLWGDDSANVDPLYPGANQGNDAGGTLHTSDYIRIPDALWLPTPLVSDGFTDTNGVSLDAHTSDGTGHAEGVAGGLGAGGSGLSWTEQAGDWDIQSNKANLVTDGTRSAATVETSEADVIIDVTTTLETATKATGIVARYADTDNYWNVNVSDNTNEFHLWERTAASSTKRASTAYAVLLATDYDIRLIAYGNTIDCYLDGGNKITYGSASAGNTVTVHGLRSNDTNSRHDNFAVYSRDGYSALDEY
jgi:hypothetical protein